MKTAILSTAMLASMVTAANAWNTPPTPAPTPAPTAPPTRIIINNSPHQQQNQNQGQQQTQNQGQSQTATSNSSSNSSSTANATLGTFYATGGNGGQANNGGQAQTTSQSYTNYGSINYIQTSGACDRATIGATVTSTHQVGLGLSVPLGRRIGCTPPTPIVESRIERCVRYAQANIVVDSLDCSDVHVRTVAVATPAPVVVTHIVTRTHTIIVHRPSCVRDITQAGDLAYMHAHRRQLRGHHQSAEFIAAHARLERACVPSSLILTALDG